MFNEEALKNLGVSSFDAADYLETDEDCARFLQAAIDDGDANVLVKALDVVSRAHGVTDLVRKTGLSRSGIYGALSGEKKPEFETVYKILKALNMKLSISANS